MCAAQRKYGNRNGNVIKVLSNKQLIYIVAKSQNRKIAKSQNRKMRIYGISQVFYYNIYIYYNRIKCLFYLLNVMNNLIAILRFCDFAILRFCDYFIYHPFNISSFPTSLKTIFPIPFAISQIYRNFAAITTLLQSRMNNHTMINSRYTPHP